MFPGYVFSRVRLGRLTHVLRVPGVATVVRTRGCPTPVRDEELEAVRRLEAGSRKTGERPVPRDFYEPGQEIVVTDGPFQGMTGYLHEERGRWRICVKLGAIGQAVGVEMDRRLLRAVA